MPDIRGRIQKDTLMTLDKFYYDGSSLIQVVEPAKSKGLFKLLYINLENGKGSFRLVHQENIYGKISVQTSEKKHKIIKFIFQGVFSETK